MSKPVPDPIFIPKSQTVVAPLIAPTTELRDSRIEEFLMARSLSSNSQRAYRQDLKAFTDWTQAPWAMGDLAR